jgi:hypothetical protein
VVSDSGIGIEVDKIEKIYRSAFIRSIGNLETN